MRVEPSLSWMDGGAVKMAACPSTTYDMEDIYEYQSAGSNGPTIRPESMWPIINQPTPKIAKMQIEIHIYAWLLGAFCINTSIVLVVLSKYQ